MLNSEENSKSKVPNQMAKSKAKTHQTNGQQLSYSWLGTGVFICRMFQTVQTYDHIMLTIVKFSLKSFRIHQIVNTCLNLMFHISFILIER